MIKALISSLHDKNKSCYNAKGVSVVKKGYEFLIEKENNTVIDVSSIKDFVQIKPKEEEQFDISYFFDLKYLFFFE